MSTWRYVVTALAVAHWRSALLHVIISAAVILLLMVIGITIVALRQRTETAEARRQRPKVFDDEDAPAPPITPETIGPIRPKLLHDSVFLPVDGGVYFRFRGKSFTLAEPGLYELVTKLMPQLTGERTFDDIASQLEPERQEQARRLTVKLLNERLAINHLQEVSDLGEPILTKFGPQIGLIEHYVDHPVRRFERFRHARIFVTGSGTPLQALALSLARNGLEQILLDDKAPPIERCAELVSCQKELRESGASFGIRRIPMSRVQADGAGAVDAICLASDAADFGSLIALNQLCRKNDIVFIPGILLAGKALVGPMVHRNQKSCWNCALLRFLATCPAETSAEIWRHIALKLPWKEDLQPDSSPALRILGNLLAFELFRLMAGHSPTETDEAVLSLDLETLETATECILPHPLCEHCSNIDWYSDRTFLAQIASGPQREQLSLSGKIELTSPLVAPDFGVATRFDDDSLDQLPLFRSELAFARMPGHGKVVFPGYSLDSNAAARLDAVLNGIRFYAARMVDERRMWKGSENAATLAGYFPVTEETLSNRMGDKLSADFERPWMHVLSLGDRTMYMVPAAAVHPMSRFNLGRFEPADAGVGVGFTAAEALEEAVLSLFAHQVLKRFSAGELRLLEISPSVAAEVNPNARYLVNAFTHLGRPLRLLSFCHEACGALVLAFGPEDTDKPDRIAIGFGKILSQAIASALRDALAIAIGGRSLRRVEDLLPGSLAYPLEMPPAGDVEQELNVMRVPANQSLRSVLLAFEGAFTDILVANLTTPDIANTHLVALKILFASDSASLV